MTTITSPGTAPKSIAPSLPRAFAALLLRDLTVLRKNLREFIPRTVLQPMLLVFVFTYVFPKIGQGIGGGGQSAAAFSTLLIAGVVATSIMFQGIQAVALPLVQEFGFTREIEDRVLAPLPVIWVAIEKIVAGSLQCLLAGLIVFPIAAFIPATPISLSINWPVAVVVIPLACLMAGSLGLTFGTFFEPRNVPVLFGVVVVPMTFLGCVYYTWASLEPIRWLQIATLANPLLYMSEGARAALTEVPHMSLWAVIPAMVGFTAMFAYVGISKFIERVID